MTDKPPLSNHPIAYVHTVEADGHVRREGMVHCTRRSESVPVSTCSHCPRFVKISTDLRGDVLHCAAEPEQAAEGELGPRLSLPRVTVSAVMTRNVVCVRPDLSLDAAASLLVESGLRAAPVVDQAGRLLGFVSECEVLLDVHAHGDGAGGLRTVGDVMLPYALTLPETATIGRAAAVMAFEGQQRIGIVSASGAIVGVLSASDILYWLAKADGHLLPRPRPR